MVEIQMKLITVVEILKFLSKIYKVNHMNQSYHKLINLKFNLIKLIA